jgi:O-antigen/teichoic acid export membrane protein
MSLARRSVTSTAWNITANLTKIAVVFFRSVLLARLLPVEVFGIYALAGSVVGLSVVIPNFGMAGAFLHRAPESEDEQRTAEIHFTLKLLFTLAWAAILATGTLIFASDEMRTALLLLTATTAGIQLTQTPRLILTRRVVHRRLALLQVLNTLFTTIVSVGLAWGGVTLWALLATDLVTLTLNVVILFVWRPVWRPRLAWSSPAVRYFLGFGSRNFLAQVLLQALNQVDDLWTGYYLGKVQLGYYSRAYTFATYPRQLLAMPINAVAGGTYAELKGDRRRLSQAFFRTNAFLVRSGFLIAGVLALIAPEFIRLFLGAKWLPMLQAFQLMLVFTLLDPIKVTVADLFIAVGRPNLVVRARLIQLVVLGAGLFLLGRSLGISGVALAVDLMLIVGIAILLWQSRTYVDLSVRELFAVPGLALALGLGLSYGAVSLLEAGLSDWWTSLTKIIVFSLSYGLVSLALERRQISEMLSLVSTYLLGSRGRRWGFFSQSDD